MKVRVTRTTVYLAGKISKHDWRGSLPHVDRWGNRQEGDHRWDDGSGEFLGTNVSMDGKLPDRWEPRNVGENLTITGPFFISCDHGCAHGPSSHGVGNDAAWIDPRYEPCCGMTPREKTLSLCVDAIAAAEVFFFWMDDRTAYGSLVELGVAKALRKTIIIARGDVGLPYYGFCVNDGHGECAESDGNGSIECHHRSGKDELWFAAQCADEIWVAPSRHDPFNRSPWSAKQALARLDAHFAPPVPEPAFGSEIERKFWKAMDGRPLATGMVAQFEYQRAGGRTFRPDFAIPQHKIAIELDGFKHHATPEAFAADLDRQREMERDGWRFVRFTGKEINADVMRCVSDAEQFILMIVGGA